MKPKTALLILTVFTIVTSCKKEKLEGDKSILIGEWAWISTIADIDICDPDYSYTEFLTPQSESNTYMMIFKKNGIIQFFQNEEIIDERRIVFNAFGSPICNQYFAISLDNKVELELDGCISNDTLVILRGFPFYDNSCNNYSNYFVRK